MSTVTLRRAGPDDAELIYRWRQAPSTIRYQPVLPFTQEQVRATLSERAMSRIAPDADGKYQWLAMVGGEPVGWITLEVSAPDRRHQKGVIGYTMGEEHRGKGYGSATVAALLPIAFGPDQLNLERLEGVAAVENTASRRVLEGNGFRLEGILRGLLVVGGVRVDHAIYGLLRTDCEGWGR
jgi:RimJ/RimL family protein N-acetyltransferase